MEPWGTQQRIVCEFDFFLIFDVAHWLSRWMMG